MILWVSWGILLVWVSLTELCICSQLGDQLVAGRSRIASVTCLQFAGYWPSYHSSLPRAFSHYLLPLRI